MLELYWVGLDAMLARFTEVADGLYEVIATEEAEELALDLQLLYQGLAPRETAGFAESISGEVGVGFNVSITTSMPQRAGWFRTGTGIYGPTGARIFPKQASVLHFTIGGQEVFAASIAGMQPIHWEEGARAAARPLTVDAGKRLVHRVSRFLAYGVA